LAGDVDQRKRLKLLQRLKDSSLHILVCTDVASRGLHIEDVTHVFNYDLPQDPEDYVHRIGRTARAGASGKAFSLACEEYVYSLQAIEDFIGDKLPHNFADESMMIEPVYVPPEPRRPRRGEGGKSTDGSRGRGRSTERGSRTRTEKPAAVQPSPKAASTENADDKGPAKKRRRRRRRKAGSATAGDTAPAVE
jgi:ATP-dependent RNA helicase RhlB